MATKRQIDLIVKARDEASGVFERVKKGARELNEEAAHSGEGALEKILRGGGTLGLVSFAFEGLTEGAKSAKEALAAYNQEQITGSEVAGRLLQTTTDAIPVLSTFTHGFGNIRDAIEDALASGAKWVGLSKEIQDALKSESTRMEEAKAANEALDKVREAFNENRHAADQAGKTGYDAQRGEVEERARIEEEALKAKIAAERQAIPKEDEGALRQFDQTAAQAIIEQHRKTAAEILKIDRQQHAEEQAEQIQFEAKMNDIRSQRRENIFRENALADQAEIEAINRQFEQQAAALKQALLKERQEHPERGLQPDAEYHQQLKNLDLNRFLEIDRVKREQRQREEDEERQHQERLNDIRAQAGVLALENAGRTYDAQLARLQSQLDQQLASIEDRYRDEIQKLKITEDPEAHRRARELERRELEEKNAARQLNFAELQKIVQDANLKFSDYRRPDLVEGQHLTGAGQSSAESNALSIGRQQLDLAKQMADIQKRLDGYLKDLHDWFVNRPTNDPPSVLNS